MVKRTFAEAQTQKKQFSETLPQSNKRILIVA